MVLSWLPFFSYSSSFGGILLKNVCPLNFEDWYADALSIGLYFIAKGYAVSKPVVDDVLLLYFLLQLHIVQHAIHHANLNKVHVTVI